MQHQLKSNKDTIENSLERIDCYARCERFRVSWMALPSTLVEEHGGAGMRPKMSIFDGQQSGWYTLMPMAMATKIAMVEWQ